MAITNKNEKVIAVHAAKYVSFMAEIKTKIRIYPLKKLLK